MPVPGISCIGGIHYFLFLFLHSLYYAVFPSISTIIPQLITMQVGYISRPRRPPPTIQRPEFLGHCPRMGLRRRDRINDRHHPGDSPMGILADREHPRLTQTPALRAKGPLDRDQRVQTAPHDRL